ncbi:alkyl hydroperoxide reductase/ Thiol specific antioxidant/ Mal allergen [Desulfurobacterium thermolithotrophum DSM 11699]|uniref:Alkyl hydroperoxide reductase/ Thiol specific antioxidant/ Mal allergen n=1 Tax=Desulfurobacterium thermolithotrophum (strain DSM 11699 / BSA) TaxID=868864 RepID=F0S0P2_DESTD|nr:TlpA disulfide reductase family protein [Desulfurobacterium thermolithotrophum]ADY73845.1 alkyl hydroperoxide reductase/ Thiol specific antioxidant/ Mal allergen [Desulfurobacterium thermolithotrophum DSM 11699]
MKKLLLIGLAFSLAFSFSCEKDKNQEPQKVKTEETSTSQNGIKAFDFSFTDVNGKPIKLSDYKGKVVVLQFFGTYCSPCKAEIPFLNRLYKEYNGKVVVIGLSVDYIGEPSSKLKPFVEEMNISYPVVASNEKAWENYAGKITGMDSIPQTFIIDKEGYIRYYNVGYIPQYDSLFEKAVKELLEEK